MPQATLGVTDIIAPSSMKINSDHIQIGSKFCRVLFVFTYPRHLITNWFSPVLTLDKEMNISMFIHPADTSTVLKQLRKKVTQVQSQISMAQEKGKVRDPMLETALQDMETLRDALQQGTEKFFYFGLYIAIFGDSVKELDDVENEIRSAMESKLVYVKPASFQQEVGFNSVLPFGQRRTPHKYTSEHRAAFQHLPFYFLRLVPKQRHTLWHQPPQQQPGSF